MNPTESPLSPIAYLTKQRDEDCGKVHAAERVACNREHGHRGKHRYTSPRGYVFEWTAR